MKTRDELAEAFAVALVGKTVDPLREWADIATDAFALSDAFVRERERRAVAPSSEGATGRVFVKCLCGKPATHRDHDDRTGRASEPCCGDLARCCILDSKDWTRAPLSDGATSVTQPEAKKPHSPDDGCAECEHYRNDVIPTLCEAQPSPLPMSAADTAPAWCPKRVPATTPAPKALRFGEDGGLLTPGGRLATVFTDGFAAETDDESCEVTFRATSRAHAERIMAAALAAGRGVK